MSYRTNKLGDGQADGRTDGRTQATTEPEGQNWPRVKMNLKMLSPMATILIWHQSLNLLIAIIVPVSATYPVTKLSCHAPLPDTLISTPLVVFGLGRIFRLERSVIFMTEFRAGLKLGARNFHLKPCMFIWVKTDSPFEVIILALYSKASTYHLTSTEFLITN